MIKNLSRETYSDVNVESALTIGKEINDFRSQMRKEHLNSIGSPEYNLKSALVYNNVVTDLEKIGDHIINVSESVIREV